MNAKPLWNRFFKVDRLIKVYNGIRYLELSNSYYIHYRMIMQFSIGLMIL